MKTKIQEYFKNKTNQVFIFLCAYCFILFVFGLCVGPIETIFKDLWIILKTPDVLVTDYFVLGSVGAAFINSALLSFIFVLLVKFCKAPFTGATIAVIGIVSGFALFGKNLINVWPIILGVFIYSKVKHQTFSKNINTALFGTTMAPLISELFTHEGWSVGLAISLAIVIGVAVGFILVPVANLTTNIHQGYVLYNTGIAAGCILVLVVGFLNVFGFEYTTANYWDINHTTLLLLFLSIFSTFLIIIAVILDKNSFIQGIKISRYSGRSVTDCIVREGLPASMVNMGLLGIVSTLYVYLVGAPLNGPTVGAILTIITFGAFGKNVRNVAFVLIGGLIGHLFGIWDFATDKSAILGILFATGMAPIGGQYGIIVGIVSGFIHVFIVKNVSVAHAGLTLYSNGFAELFDSIILLSVVEIFKGKDGSFHERKRKKDPENN